MKLTQQQIDSFNREGWLFLPELFSAEEVALLAREAEELDGAIRCAYTTCNRRQASTSRGA